MKKSIISVAPMNFVDKKSGEAKTMYKIYLIADSGDVGFLYSTVEHKVGDTIELYITAGRDGRLAVKIKEPIPTKG